MPSSSQQAYEEILALLSNVLDTAEDDITRSALDPVAALRTRVETLTTALRISLVALSCHGQKKDFIIKASHEIAQIVQLQEAWNQGDEA